ncbi:MAG: hypothetical protein WDN27_00650 [Candidatus Saccharibacteria bacterium]
MGVQRYDLPYYNGDYVLLTPKDILTRDDTWINRKDLIEDFYLIPPAISDAALRDSVNAYFRSMLPKKPKRSDEREAAVRTVHQFPQLIDYYIKIKEQSGEQATSISKERVVETEECGLSITLALQLSNWRLLTFTKSSRITTAMKLLLSERNT